jgi:hypothetical protein
VSRVAEVNRALKARGVAEKLTRGRDYYYFRDGDSSCWPSTSVYTCYSDDLTVAEWLQEYDQLREAARLAGRISEPKASATATRRSVHVEWTPVPRRPWAVRDAAGRAVRRFDDAAAANAYARRLEGRR